MGNKKTPWKITSIDNVSCYACSKKIGGKKQYTKRTKGLLAAFLSIWFAKYYCSQSCYKSNEG